MSHQEIDDRPGDAELAAAVMEALQRDADVQGDRIAVTVTDGWVMLSGSVEHVVQWSMIDCTARYVPGVRGVTNQLQVSDAALGPLVDRTTAFARVSPTKKNRILLSRRWL